LLIGGGLSAAGIVRFPNAVVRGSSCAGSTFLAALLAPRLRSVFLSGMVNGMLPCGLVYAYLALAASSGDMLRGGTTMALFGLGTMPVMVALGCSGSLLRMPRRFRLLRVAAWCVVLTGILSVLRGLAFLPAGAPFESYGCPTCH
jgi:sulfite exporter TauE/SafE